MKEINRTFITALCAVLVGLAWITSPAVAQEKKPNIVVIWGDDIGVHNISAYSLGVMGYKTPNIDRLAKEGALFTDAYPQQSCSAGRGALVLYPRQAPVPHRVAHHRHAGLAARHSGLGTDNRRPAQGAGLHDRPVRQEPPRRPQPTFTDGAWV